MVFSKIMEASNSTTFLETVPTKSTLTPVAESVLIPPFTAHLAHLLRVLSRRSFIVRASTHRSLSSYERCRGYDTFFHNSSTFQFFITQFKYFFMYEIVDSFNVYFTTGERHIK